MLNDAGYDLRERKTTWDLWQAEKQRREQLELILADLGYDLDKLYESRPDTIREVNYSR